MYVPNVTLDVKNSIKVLNLRHIKKASQNNVEMPFFVRLFIVQAYFQLLAQR